MIAPVQGTWGMGVSGQGIQHGLTGVGTLTKLSSSAHAKALCLWSIYTSRVRMFIKQLPQT